MAFILVFAPAMFALAALGGGIALLQARRSAEGRIRPLRVVVAVVLLVFAFGVVACYGTLFGVPFFKGTLSR